MDLMEVNRPHEWNAPEPAHIGREIIYDPLSTREFGLYRGHRTGVDTYIMSLDTSNDEILLPELTSTIYLDQVHDQDTLSTLKGLYIHKAQREGEVYYLVMPMKKPVVPAPRGPLRMFVSREEFERISEANEIDIDEATGRVIIRGWEDEGQGG